MFKKREKKDHSVINFGNEEANNAKNEELSSSLQEKSILNQKSQNSPYSNEDKNQKKSENNKISYDQSRQNETTHRPQSNNETKNNIYAHDNIDEDDQILSGQPRKIVKLDFEPHKRKIFMTSTTQTQRQSNQQHVHKTFNSLSYEANRNLKEIYELQPDKLEEELAKERYLHNVEMTKQAKAGKLDTSIYRGINSYANHAMTDNDITNAEQNFKKRQGPSRINSTIKNTCRFDYVQNICKDWHDSGYCPFGDSCLYLHDRSNHKTGWELEKEYEKCEKQRWKRINNPELALRQAKQASLKTIQKYKPIEDCLLCKEKLKNAVEIECGHLYCMNCALKLSKCQQCGKKSNGIMNNAEKKLQKQTKQYQEMKLKLEKENQDSLVKRRRWQHLESIDVFND